MTHRTPGRVLMLVAVVAACSTPPDPESFYRPTESLLEVLAVLRLHRDDDTYLFEPARDFTGKNVYRAALTRLENFEELYRERLLSGHMMAEIPFAKGRALERITEYSLAARHYAVVSRLDSVLAAPAAEAMAVCQRLDLAADMAPEPLVPPDEAMATFDRRLQALDALRVEVGETHYRAVVREEIERAQVARARFFEARSRLDPSLAGMALQQHQSLVEANSESKNRNRHLLALADFYSVLSRQYVEQNPPISLGFDPATFDEYAHGASLLYEAVSRQDGAIEKIEAARKLEAYLAYTLEIHAEKIPR